MHSKTILAFAEQAKKMHGLWNKKQVLSQSIAVVPTILYFGTSYPMGQRKLSERDEDDVTVYAIISRNDD